MSINIQILPHRQKKWYSVSDSTSSCSAVAASFLLAERTLRGAPCGGTTTGRRLGTPKFRKTLIANSPDSSISPVSGNTKRTTCISPQMASLLKQSLPQSTETYPAHREIKRAACESEALSVHVPVRKPAATKLYLVFHGQDIHAMSNAGLG